MTFKWWKFGTYLGIGLLVFGTWAFFNYANYVQTQLTINKKIETNVNMIKETINDIETEQQELRMVQRVFEPPIPESSRAPSSEHYSGYGGMSAAPAPPPPAASTEVDPMYAELQARIDALEAEKEALKEEKSVIKRAIEDTISVFSGVKVENPLVNAIFIPIFLYFIKKMLDFCFARLEEKFEVRVEGEA